MPNSRREGLIRHWRDVFAPDCQLSGNPGVRFVGTSVPFDEAALESAASARTRNERHSDLVAGIPARAHAAAMEPKRPLKTRCGRYHGCSVDMQILGRSAWRRARRFTHYARPGPNERAGGCCLASSRRTAQNYYAALASLPANQVH